MAKIKLRAALLAALALAAGAASAHAQADPQVTAILKYTPVQPGIAISTPAADEVAGCKSKVITVGKGSGYLLTDAKGQKLRLFLDTNGDKKIDVYSYFKDDVEVYREIEITGNDKPDMFRWLGPAGMKWGHDLNEDGKIDSWRMISAEEAAEEAFHALVKGDVDRFKALLISDEDMKFLKLPAAEVDRLAKRQKAALEKFNATRGKLPAGAQFERLESAVASCTAADGTLEKDLIKFNSRMILFNYEKGGEKGGDRKHDWLDTGEMIQVGYAWRLTDAPAPHTGNDTDTKVEVAGKDLQTLYDALAVADKALAAAMTAGKTEAIAKANMDRVAVLQKINVIEPKADVRESWTKQICDNLSTAYQSGHDAAITDLAALRADFAKKEPAGNMTAYASYREMWGKYARAISGKLDQIGMQKVQDEWLANLSNFVKAFPKADDTPDALHQLAMGAEYAEKDEEAKRWYKELYTTFAASHLAEKAKGAERRLGLIGQAPELKAQTMDGKAFNIVNTKGKVVVMYYWSANVSVCKRDFDILASVLNRYADKGLEIVTINLDEERKEAADFLAASALKATHVGDHGKNGGMGGPLGTYYGINSLPTIFLIGRDGRVVNRTVQAPDLEAALKKAL